ncbi:MAG: dephospho-CoA kinase [Oscillospiraceae bacterium]|nr:dephospho-CoA kinase [Oscillospiraceae bacterium]
MMKVIGITGGSGAGKSTALGVLAEMGARIIDCDRVYHELIAAGGPVLEELEARFPGVIVGGQLDRKALGKIVFGDADALEALNGITHRYVCAEVYARLTAYAEADVELVAVEAIALLESGIAARCDMVVGVVAPIEERVRRIVAREGIDPAYALARVESQKSDGFFRAGCDFVLVNDGADAAAFADECRFFFVGVL